LPSQILEATNEIRALTSKPFGIDLLFPAEIDRKTQDMIDQVKANLSKEYEDYYQWMDEIREKYGLSKSEDVSNDAKNALNPDFVREQFDAALEAEGPVAICSGVGTSKWAVDRIHEAGKLSVSLVGNVRQAKAVASLGTDIIVAQGTEAGGHTGKIGTLALVPQVVDAVSPIPVLAAGGLGDARGVAAGFTLGAKGAWIGTAFLASQEADITDGCKQKIIDSDESGTEITPFFTGKTARLIKHPIAEEWRQAGFKSLGMPFQLYSIVDLLDSMEKTDSTELFVLPAGQVSGIVKKIRPASEIFDDFVSGTVKILNGCDLEGITISNG
jgi:NAD(P)H-dependent flavin oxidoreductase YrpB (nitropropane dioxygenase family)